MALRLIEALQRSGQAEAADDVLEPVRPAESAQRPRPDPARRRGDAGAGLAGRDRASTRACAGGSATMTRPSSTTSPGPMRRAAISTARVPLARRAWALDRDNPATADTLGWLLFKSGADRAERPRPARARRPRRPERRRRSASRAGARRAARLAQAPARSRFSSASGITVTFGMVAPQPLDELRRPRRRSPSVAPSGLSSSRRRRLRLGRGHRQHPGR